MYKHAHECMRTFFGSLFVAINDAVVQAVAIILFTSIECRLVHLPRTRARSFHELFLWWSCLLRVSLSDWHRVYERMYTVFLPFFTVVSIKYSSILVFFFGKNFCPFNIFLRIEKASLCCAIACHSKNSDALDSYRRAVWSLYGEWMRMSEWMNKS